MSDDAAVRPGFDDLGYSRTCKTANAAPEGSGAACQSRSISYPAGRLQPADEELALVEHFLWQVVVQVEEEFLVANQLLPPGRAIDGLQLLEGFARIIDSRPVDVIVPWLPADWRFLAARASAHPVDDPFQDAHVVGIARPEEATLFVLAEPVHMEDARRLAERALHLDPVTEVVAHVIPA